MNARRAFLVGALALLGGFGLHGGALAASPEEQDAINAAEKWLVSVDAGKSADSWAMASAPFKSAVGKQQWTTGLRDLRKPYGKVASRKAERLAHVGERDKAAETPPGAKTNDQVAIIFDTKFAGGKSANEEITLVRENDGIWRVAGYFIR
jgi:hypothetical protein